MAKSRVAQLKPGNIVNFKITKSGSTIIFLLQGLLVRRYGISYTLADGSWLNFDKGITFFPVQHGHQITDADGRLLRIDQYPKAKLLKDAIQFPEQLPKIGQPISATFMAISQTPYTVEQIIGLREIICQGNKRVISIWLIVNPQGNQYERVIFKNNQFYAKDIMTGKEIEVKIKPL